MSRPLDRKTYLRALPGTKVSTRYSRGSQRRAAQVQRFLQTLSEAAAPALGTSKLSLTILSRQDWQVSYPYSFPFTRGPDSKGTGSAQIVAAAAYQERFLHRFDDFLVRAAQEGFRAPGELREFLDLTLGLEWGHAVLRLNGLASERWLDELLATYLFLLTLHEAGLEDVAERFVAWSALLAEGCEVEDLALSAFVYPRGKARLGHALFFQGLFTQQAVRLLGRPREDAWASLEEAQRRAQGASGEKRAGLIWRNWPELEAWLESLPVQTSEP